MQLAPVSAQIALAKEIGSNEWYMNYLLGIDGIKAWQVVWVAKADALANGDMKVMVNTGDTDSGVNSLMDLLSGKWWASIWAMLEVLKQTPAWQELYDKFIKIKEQSTQTDNTIVVETTNNKDPE
jgi:flotillin